ncbi:MAG: polysaccharide deacetylase family protein [candidate division WS1 bacterium]|nr:polysaccharide deacetylase family protein [candidate division WS1 bacterium]
MSTAPRETQPGTAPTPVATEASAAEEAPVQPTTDSHDWSVPEIFRSHIIGQRKKGFPRKLLALTIDDGPSPSDTPVVLEKLRQYGAHATFFVLGYNASRWPKLVAQAAAEGHCVGIHSYSHIAKCTSEQAVKNLHLTAEMIERATGKKPTVFRPPYGITTNELTKLARKEGYPVILWSLSSADTSPRIFRNADLIARNVIFTPNPGEIILMHDGGGHMASARALDQIIPQLQAKGWEFVTVPELLRAWAEWMAAQPPKAPPPNTSAGKESDRAPTP